MDDISGEELRATKELEASIRAEAERCAKAIKLLGGGEVRFIPEGMESAALLACFLLELENQCAKIGVTARVAFSFYLIAESTVRAQAANDDSRPAGAVH